ncbi:hypothetical protein [Eisenibacter elegans]|jgi:heat shock protein HslJ|uniref:hypothetical protein n=1 Tax=Eisenibacter elegans TaxID=997 RepID=UPI0003FA87F7|nr:hypothetical protein [Eisenibacter elegans]
MKKSALLLGQLGAMLLLFVTHSSLWAQQQNYTPTQLAGKWILSLEQVRASMNASSRQTFDHDYYNLSPQEQKALRQKLPFFNFQANGVVVLGEGQNLFTGNWQLQGNNIRINNLAQERLIRIYELSPQKLVIGYAQTPDQKMILERE